MKKDFVDIAFVRLLIADMNWEGRDCDFESDLYFTTVPHSVQEQIRSKQLRNGLNGLMALS